ncbi:phytanoyl-CoA dioxygenase family protein [Naematelia encephala]|uniref:Phytanoyl-CoA dioxygenase family protein n=1 Tax=Naematelia encephala TaxID=71784 RepID=A0A1Y2AV02_9TREE|nr:phytanoyl-CoA dioxygenase family protein [Naematelia encephala]
MAPSCTLQECVIDASAPFEDIYNLLILRGGIVVKNLLDVDTCMQMKSELQPYLDAQAPKPGQEWQGSFFPKTTRKVSGVLTRSKTFGTALTMNPLYLALNDRILSRRNKMRNTQTPKWSTAKPQVNQTSILEIHPGAIEQDLHRDDCIFHRVLPAVDKWTVGRDVSTLCFVALSKVTPANGGTLFIPGSHLTGYEYAPKKEDALRAEMEIGDAFIMLCHTYHGGGSNTMKEGEANSVRTLAATGMTLGFLKQEENQYISHDIEKIAQLSPELQELAGWNISLPYLGWVDFSHPARTLGRHIPDGDHLFFDEDQSEAVAI